MDVKVTGNIEPIVIATATDYNLYAEHYYSLNRKCRWWNVRVSDPL